MAAVKPSLLVVLPVCQRDQHLALSNLDLIRHLEPSSSLPIPLDVLLTTDDSFDPSAVAEAVRPLFRRVQVYRYPRSWNGSPPPWPWPQNWAWQQSAKEIERRHATNVKPLYSHWFWWEADCVPLRAGAFLDLAAGAAATKSPFAGHLESHFGTTYMAGPGCYPFQVSRYLDSALRVRKAPFDVVAGMDDGLSISGRIAPLTLLQHRWREDNEGDTFTSAEDIHRIINPEAAFFHRCDDGSLAWVLSSGALGTRPTPHLSHSGSKQSLESTQDLCRALLASLHLPTPSLAHQTPWPGGIFHLPLSPGEIYFNPAVVEGPGGSLLITRLTRNMVNSLVIWSLDPETMTASHPVCLRALALSEHFEDPRCIWWKEKKRFILSLCNYDLTRHYHAHQTVLECSPTWSVQAVHHPVHGRNGPALHLNTGHEKNWTPWLHDGQLHLVYSINPHVVLRLAGGKVEAVHSTSHSSIRWPWGELRGGTPPIRHDSEWLSFFHSSIPWRVVHGAVKRRYLMGAYAFSTKPPFKITRLTKAPLLVGSETDPLLPWSPLVVFPGGVILDGEDYLVVGGCNDSCCFWQRFPVKEIEKQLQPL